ncbi:hypothetical protein ASD11_01225 [Aeromicrobium sp. Root495]|uniref:hypothetical protein n=1 Tax=Aeromicrobium sp. Root495 TaxID=1736550 RepID=UPI0006FF694F|nr:hypothetical protein [Aeromicrobium sp. Root495]KQY58317.1 hypothetical protein ASD11_01225 [Aeromicrobium sp. Root495]
MATRIRIKMNDQGVRDVLRSEGVRADLLRRAQAMADAGGEGMEASSEVGQIRARATVRTATPDAMRAEAEDRALTRAIDAGRG